MTVLRMKYYYLSNEMGNTLTRRVLPDVTATTSTSNIPFDK